MFHAGDVESATGWKVVWRRGTTSTNDDAAALRDGGPADRVVVVADRQSAGRGRAGRRFASPTGGLYASLVVRARPEDVPGPLVAATSVALAEAVESVTGAAALVKWPNDVWIDGKKVAGIIAEAAARSFPAGSRVGVVIGVGVNVRGVPSDLEPDVLAATTALDLHAETPVRREDVLRAFLPRLDRLLHGLETPAGRDDLEARYRSRAALVGVAVRYFVGDAEETGTLRDVSVARGLLVERDDGASSWRPMAQVREVRAVIGP